MRDAELGYNTRMPVVVMRSPRLHIRHFRRGDLDAVAALHADPAVMRYMGTGRPLTRQESARWLLRQLPENAQHKAAYNHDWAVVLAETGRFIGRCGIMPCEVAGGAEVEFGYALLQEYWGQGYATEVALALVAYARDVAGLPRLIAMTHPQNRASAQVIVKAGLTLEREVVLPKGPRLIFGIDFYASAV